MFEYNIVQMSYNYGIFNDFIVDQFNNRLVRLLSEGWQKTAEPTLNVDHTHFTIVLKREIPNTTGPYR